MSRDRRQLEFNPVESSGDFETDVSAGYYATNSGQDFMADFVRWLEAMGVPQKYSRKAAEYLYQEHHGYGHHQIVLHASDFCDIFKK